MNIHAREAAPRVRALLRTFPAVVVIGPRQCGKTTLVRELFQQFHHFDLEREGDLLQIREDISGFLERESARPIVIDEAQRLPELFTALRPAIDRTARRGRYILTGSASPDLMRGVSETLAGRVGVLELTPLSAHELRNAPSASVRSFWGGFPRVLALRSEAARSDWLESYVQTYLQRDLPNLGLRLSATRMRMLWTMLTHVHGNLLNMSDLARSLGVSVPTIQSNLDVLEHTFMVRRLPPYFANIQKRLAKTPKIYIRDTGLLHHLAGLRSVQDLDTWDRRGASFEGLVIEEVVERFKLRHPGTQAFFWGTQGGGEVDLMLVNGRRVTPIEIKYGSYVDPRQLQALRICMKDLGLERGYVIYRGRERVTLSHGITAIPWGQGADILDRLT